MTAEAGLKEMAGMEVSAHGEGLAQSPGLASTGSCKYINRASPGKTSNLFIIQLVCLYFLEVRKFENIYLFIL